MKHWYRTVRWMHGWNNNNNNKFRFSLADRSVTERKKREAYFSLRKLPATILGLAEVTATICAQGTHPSKCFFTPFITIFILFLGIASIAILYREFTAVMRYFLFSPWQRENNPAGTISPQRIVVWQFFGPTYEEIGIKCAVINLT